MKQHTMDEMCCIIHLKLRMYLNAWYPIKETSFIPKYIRQETEENGMMPLHLACWHQNKQIVMYVLEKYNNATTVHNRNRNYPFNLTCDWYECLPTGIVHILLKNTFRDALCWITNHDNSLPLHYCVQSNPTSTHKLFFLTQMIYQYPESLWIMNELSETPLTIACQYCNENVIWLFLIYSPEAVNNMDNNGNLPIHHIPKQKPLVNCNIIQQLVNIAPTMCIKPAPRINQTTQQNYNTIMHYVIILILP